MSDAAGLLVAVATALEHGDRMSGTPLATPEAYVARGVAIVQAAMKAAPPLDKELDAAEQARREAAMTGARVARE